MAVIGLDDTDSRDRGMCTTYLAARLASRFRSRTTVDRPRLVRLNPAVPYKTRGNAALALHVDLPAETAFTLARRAIDAVAETDDPATHPGLVVAPGSPQDVTDAVLAFSRSTMREERALEEATALIATADYLSAGWKTGRGLIGALAAIGAWQVIDDPTYELIAYRERPRWGTPRSVDIESVFAAAESAYPATWDTVDRGAGEPVCVPHTPGPVLYGIRGDDPGAVRAVASRIEAEPVAGAAVFVTNQGTDPHLQAGTLGSLEDGQAYQVDGVVADPPETRRGGHVFFPLRAPMGADTIDCVAFEPTKRFRDWVRALRAGDQLTVCGEVAAGTLKLEKFAVRSLVTTVDETPTCPTCTRRMESAGADQGYRCRRCETTAPGPVTRAIERDLERGWYEVPAVARRHVAKPLVRGGFDAPVHPAH